MRRTALLRGQALQYRVTRVRHDQLTVCGHTKSVYSASVFNYHELLFSALALADVCQSSLVNTALQLA